MVETPKRIAHATAKSKEGEPTFCKKCGTLLIDAAGPTMREGAPLILQKDPSNPGTPCTSRPGQVAVSEMRSPVTNASRAGRLPIHCQRR